ncbi:uncharacterized protein VP01_1800g8 [Puccinia sorghi]|uniref:SAM-dependent MTase RsmB/NOP-type domain-containing protein n=1 Tax=Puccinia sorghi TaxID=27349 RepID=A0A0L6VEE0_9BASI|nr:uncharacterized protein VP01_1800g8 [Puccinia sorghi]
MGKVELDSHNFLRIDTHQQRNKSRSNHNNGGHITVKKSNQRWDSLPETNEAFVEYYKNQQKITETEEEWNQLFTSFRTDLPTTLRVTGGKKLAFISYRPFSTFHDDLRQNADQLNKIIEDTYVPFLSNLRINNELVPPPQKISWYPNGMAWEFRAPKQLIRKSAELKKKALSTFQNFLVYESEAGNLSRQEAVSMVPPLLLDVQSHHYVMSSGSIKQVLDACAAPGSKTAQLVESLHQSTPGLIPEGLIIANDSDYKRSHLLVHHSLRRLPSPSTMVTNHDATRFPTLSLKGRKLLFDRILCDVPCSGDGTLRKNGGIWRDWTPANGIGLHGSDLTLKIYFILLLKISAHSSFFFFLRLQLRILSRAISLLKPGGRIVYSTCSLNPLENEAVVSAALSQYPSMSIKDVSACLPTLIRRPGLTSWTVTTRDPNKIKPVASPNDLLDLPPNKKYPLTLWPSGNEVKHGLERCLRIYPHLQDTGGFFVAVLEKSAAATNGNAHSTNPAETSPATKKHPVQDGKKLAKGLLDGEGTVQPPIDATVAGALPSKQPAVKLSDDNDNVQATAQIVVTDEAPSGEPIPKVISETSHTVESNEQKAASCTSTEPIEMKQVKRAISTEAVEASTSRPDSKRVKIETANEGVIPTTEKSEIRSIEADVSGQDPPDILPLENTFKEEPHVFLKSDHEEIKKCMEFYDINSSFPADNLLVRNAEGLPTRTIYLTSSVAREVIENNSHVRLRLICCGVKIFCRQDPSASTAKDMKAADPEKFCKWRIVSDGIDFFRPFMGSKRVIQCHLNVLKQLMRHDQQYPLITELEDEAFREQVRQLDIGSCVAEISGDTQDDASHHVPLDLMVGLWISKCSINLMVDKKERQVLSLRLWGEDITFNPNLENRASSLANNQDQPPNPKPTAEDPEATKPDPVEVNAEEDPMLSNPKPVAQLTKNEDTNVPSEEVKVEADPEALNADQANLPTENQQVKEEVVNVPIKPGTVEK